MLDFTARTVDLIWEHLSRASGNAAVVSAFQGTGIYHKVETVKSMERTVQVASQPVFAVLQGIARQAQCHSAHADDKARPPHLHIGPLKTQWYFMFWPVIGLRAWGGCKQQP